MILNLGCIVEGHGEVQAVPVLLRRLGQQCDPRLSLRIGRPIRTGRYKVVKLGELERTVELAARQLPKPRAILILIDAEDDCPKELAPDLETIISEVIRFYEIESSTLRVVRRDIENEPR